MARLALTTNTLDSSGDDVADFLQAFGVDGVAINNTSGNAVVLIHNGNAGVATITVDVPNVVDGSLIIPDRTYTIPAGEYWLIKPFSRAVYNQDDSVGSGFTSAVLLSSSITNGDVKIAVFVAPRG